MRLQVRSSWILCVSALNLQWSACTRPPPAGSRLREGLNCAFSNCPVENKWACLRNQWQHLFIAAQSHPPPPPPAALGEPLPWRSSILTNVWMWKWNSWRQWGAQRSSCATALLQTSLSSDLSLWTYKTLAEYQCAQANNTFKHIYTSNQRISFTV